MKLQHLRFLTAVVNSGGVIKAAERLHLSQPTITTGLKTLEQRLGKALFERTGNPNKPLKLTPAGHRFYLDATEILRQCELAHATLMNSTTTLHRVRIGLIETLPQHLAIQVIQALQLEIPNIEITLREGSPKHMATLLSQHRIDLAWTNVNDLVPNTHPLWKEPLVAVLPKEHALAQETTHPISIQDLEKIPFIFRAGCELDAVGRAQLKASRVTLTTKVKVIRDAFAFQLVRAGEGFTFAPQSIVPEDLASVPVNNFRVERTIGLQWQESLDSTLRITMIEIARNKVPNSPFLDKH